KGVRRQILVVAGAVVAGVGDELDAARLCEPPEQAGIAADVSGRALDEGTATEWAKLLQVGQRDAANFLGYVVRRAGLRGPDEVDHHMLVDERDAESVGGDRAVYGLDLGGHGVPCLSRSDRFAINAHSPCRGPAHRKVIFRTWYNWA